MTALQCALWGVFGAFAVEGMEFAGEIRRSGWPWRKKSGPGPIAYFISVVIRFAVSGGLAMCFGYTGQFAGPLGPLSIGIAAPLIVEKLARQVAAAAVATALEGIQPGGGDTLAVPQIPQAEPQIAGEVHGG